jgi:indolepyruvate ferredoxin oxidoreductase alpha subunit
MKEAELLLGDEAIALGAIHGGVSGAYGYPGTPSTEILEYILPKAADHGIKGCWATNEKVAYELAVGMAFAGKRTIVTMKHVGLNVAMDPFMSSALTGVSGGFLVIVADDPGMHSSQNEQDTRALSKFALLPCFEPCDQQEAYDMTRAALDFSEKVKLPVVMRIVTRLAHSRARVVGCPPVAQNGVITPVSENRAKFTTLPQNSRRQYANLVESQAEMQKHTAASPFNTLDLTATDRTRGIIVSGIAYNYVREAFGGKIPFPFLKIGQYPLPEKLVRELFDAVDEVVVVEEGYPVIEESLRGLLNSTKKPVRGKYDGFLPRVGELTPTIVARSFGVAPEIQAFPSMAHIPARPPALCKGCPHADAFNAIEDVLKEHKAHNVFGDIGCYTLGYYEPFNTIDACLEMGASIGMSVGASQAGAYPVIGVIGDSTFTHSGVTGLLTAVKQNADVNIVILDNDTTAMTGGQESTSVGESLYRLVLGTGIDEKHVRVLNPMPKLREENAKIVREEVNYHGPSVLIFKRPCLHVAKA